MTDLKPDNPTPAPCSAAYKYTCTEPYTGVGRACNNKFAVPCVCSPKYNKTCSAASTIGDGLSCEGKYAGCKCGYSFNQTCVGKYEGVGEACTLDDHTLEGPACAGKYETCQCVLEKFPETCAGDLVGVGEECQGQLKSCCNNKCPDGYTSASSCDSGWEYSTATNYAGNNVCGKCTLKTIAPPCLLFTKKEIA